jgi:VWFA-related protein
MSLERLAFRPEPSAGRTRRGARLSPILNRGVMPRDRIVASLIAALLLAAALAGAGTDPPLTAADVVRFLKAGISERTILAELDARGFGEPLDGARESALRAAGATETLIVALRRREPVAPAAAPVAPPAAKAPSSAAASGPSTAAAAPSGLTFSASARSVRVPVSVLYKRGEPVLGLTGEDFKLSEDGRRQAVTFFSGERRPLRIALALDVSASMRDKMEEVGDALRHFINLLEPADEIMVITFSGTIHVDQDFTSDRELLERVFSRLQPDQGTALYDAAMEAVRRVAPGPAESKAVVLVTDGVDTASSATFDQVREIARRSEVPVFSIGIGGEASALRQVLQRGGGIGRRPPIGGGWPGGGRWPGGGGGGRGWPPTGGGRGWPGPTGGGRPSNVPLGGPEPDFDARPLLDLADDTGGRAEILKGDASADGSLKHAVESIAVTLRHRYLVGYEPDSGKSGWRKIRVEVDRPSTKVQARKGYYAEG